MTRKAVLEQALKLTTGTREQTHGRPEDSFATIAALWSAYMGQPVTPEDVCHLMTLLKIGRMQHGQQNADDYIDAIGYQALAAELAGVNV